MGLRVLGRVRLSRYTDESTSVERQKEIITAWANDPQRKHVIIGWAVDTDVSRSVNPFDAPDLGPWLNDPEKSDQWDIVASWKLDRIAVGSIYLNDLMKWCNQNRKVLVSVTENLDLSTWVGELVANVIAGVAKGEWALIQERTQESQAKLRALGRWHGGVVPFGYIPVKTADGWKLNIDPVSSVHVESIFADVLAGKAIDTIADRLNAEGVPTPRDYYRMMRMELSATQGYEYTGKPPEGKKWNGQTLFKLIESKTYLGHVTHHGVTETDDQGEPVTKADQLIDTDTWNRVQAAVKARRFTKQNNRTSKASPLLGVILCMECEINMHHRANTVDGKRYRYYYCPDKHGQSVRAEEFEELFGEAFIRIVGDTEVLEKTYVPAIDHTLELQDKSRTAEELATMLTNTKSAAIRATLTAKLSALDARITELEKLPPQPARTEYRPAGYTYAAKWSDSDTEERRQLLLKSGIRVKTIVTGRGRKADAKGEASTQLLFPADILARLGKNVRTDWRTAES